MIKRKTPPSKEDQMRLVALDMAVRIADHQPHDPTPIVKRAEEFLKFLKGDAA